MSRDLVAMTTPWDSALVMMVDDESMMTDVIQTHLEDAGYTRFVACNDPRQAVQLIRQHQPDVLLLDLMMPEVSGFDVLQAVRADEALQYTPVIVLTAASDPATKLRALELGATEFLSKPVDSSELVLRVRNTLAFKRYQDRLANVDLVTGLPNRERFTRRLDEALQHALPDQTMIGLLHLDCEQFRQTRETLGPRAADTLLQKVAQCLINTVVQPQEREEAALNPESLGLARVDSQDFALILPELTQAEDAATLAKDVILALTAAPFQIDGHDIFLVPRIGIALAPSDGQSANGLLKSADLACSKVKGHGKSGYEFFSAELTARSIERLTLTNQLRLGIHRDELRLHYQPKVCMRTGRILGAEALVRWQHPDHGLLFPGRFVPLAEETGLIVEIGDWVTQEACRQMALWKQQGLRDIKVSINVAKPQFDNGHFFQYLQKVLAQTQLPPEWLMVEVTESMLVSDVSWALKQMNDLQGLGVKLSIDDFGTGYSSLSYLKRFPADELKIDRSFIIDLPGQAKDQAIVQTVVSLGHSLGMQVVAEGVEEEGQLRVLQRMGCDVLQGFLFSKAVPPQAFEALILGSSAQALINPAETASV
ncbi:MAG: EAL domain-containing response regulator [Rubrivivax sp.]|nr:MAG: EAL domain-containing response regulator [Rubrivivax sp.]